MSKRFAVIVAFCLVFASCGGGEENDQVAGEGSPGATATAGAGGTSSPGADGGGSSGGQGSQNGGGGGGSGGGTEATLGPVKTAAPGTVNRPKAGSYVYAVKGEGTDPTNPTGPKQTAPPNATSTRDLSHSGEVTTAETTESSGTGVVTTRSRWRSDAVHLLSINTDIGITQFGCVFDPPILTSRIPVKAGTIPTQNWSGDDCEGSTDINIVGKENRKDANGKTWSTWKVIVKTTFRFQDVSGTQEGTQWFSPDLGVEVHSEGSTSGQLGTGPTAQKFSQTGSNTLKSYP